MVAALGGPGDLIERGSDRLETAPIIADIPALQPGRIARIDVRAVGLAVVRLGGGRSDPSASIDHAVGFDRFAQLGDAVRAGATIARVHARDKAAAEAAAQAVQAAFEIVPG
ncbi:hypothetical protein BH09PSE6_BH09PSE6_10360 [soil metagenome]